MADVNDVKEVMTLTNRHLAVGQSSIANTVGVSRVVKLLKMAVVLTPMGIVSLTAQIQPREGVVSHGGKRKPRWRAVSVMARAATVVALAILWVGSSAIKSGRLRTCVSLRGWMRALSLRTAPVWTPALPCLILGILFTSCGVFYELH